MAEITMNNSIHSNGSNTAVGGKGTKGSVWKDDEAEATEDEEIKKNEEDLDNAIREEELIEEELRQVEKDFEMV